METTQRMATLVWVYILFFIMLTPSLSSSNKVIPEKDERTYASEKLSFGLGWSLGGFPSFGIGLGGGEGDSIDSPGQTSSDDLEYASPGFGFGGGVRTSNGGNTDSGFNFGGGFDFGAGSSSYGGGGGSIGVAGARGGGDYEGSSRPKGCHCNCDRTGGISSKSNRQNDRNPPSKTVTCRPMNCLNENNCGGYSKNADGSPPYWCKVSGKGILPFWCTNRGESFGKLLNCVQMNCPKGAACGGDGARYVLDIPIWINGYGSQSSGAYGHRDQGHN